MQLKFSKFTLPVLAFAASSVTAYADELLVIPRAEAGFSAYSLQFDGQILTTETTPGLNANSKLGDTFFVYRAGITVAFNDFYVDLLGSSTSDFSDVQIIPGLNAIEKWTGNRDEINVTLGYQVFETGSVFVGYRTGEIEAIGAGDSNFKYESDGFYIGMNYGLPIGESGVLSFNAAYAFLDATLDNTLFSQKLVSADGDGNGTKIGVSWQDSITDSVRYSISVDQYRYKTDVNSSNGSELEMIETESAIRMGISRIF